MKFGETIASALPWDIPWWSPDFAIFFGFLYMILLVLGLGLGLVFYKTLKDMKKTEENHH